jgi:hypothetical protein
VVVTSFKILVDIFVEELNENQEEFRIAGFTAKSIPGPPEWELILATTMT